MNRRVLNLISTLFVITYLLIWVLPGSADSGLVKVTSPQPSVAMELFGHPDSGTTAITPIMASTEIYFPHFADSSSWWTGIAVANPGQVPANVIMRAYNDSGGQIGQDFERTIPSQSQMEPAVIHTLFSLTGTETGWIKLTSSQPVVALEIFGHTNSGGIAGFSPAPAATEICIPHFAEDQDWWTGIAVANPGAVNTTVSIAAFSDAGDPIGDIYEVPIAAGCRMTPQIIRNLISLGEHTSGWLKITAPQPVAAMEIFGQFTTSMIAGLSAGVTDTKLYYPYFQEGSGNWTGIAIANPGATEVRVTLKALNNAGDKVGEINDYVVPASGRMTPQTITGLFGNLDNQTGCLEVTASHPVAGLGVMGGNGWLAGYTAVKKQTGTLAFPHFADSDGWWTKLTLVNTSDDTATLSMAAYGITGAPVGVEKSVDLGPFAAVVENLPVSGPLYTINEVETKIRNTLTEDLGFDAIVLALDKGYSITQIVVAAMGNRLSVDGSIIDINNNPLVPKYTPSNLIETEIEMSSQTHVELADTRGEGLSMVKLGDFKDEFSVQGFDPIIILQLALRGYSLEQIFTGLFLNRIIYIARDEIGLLILNSDDDKILTPAKYEDRNAGGIVEPLPEDDPVDSFDITTDTWSIVNNHPFAGDIPWYTLRFLETDATVQVFEKDTASGSYYEINGAKVFFSFFLTIASNGGTIQEEQYDGTFIDADTMQGTWRKRWPYEEYDEWVTGNWTGIRNN